MWGDKSLLLFILMQNQILRNSGWVVLLMLFTTLASQAQVKVGDSPTILNEGAVLEMQSTNRGMLLPRISLSSTTAWGLNGNNAIKNGMVVYNTNALITGNATYPAAGVGTYTFDGTGWVFSNVPKGGTAGQVLSKNSSNELVWNSPASGVVRYTVGSATEAGAIVKATGPGVTFSVDISTQTATFTIPSGVELLAVRMWEMNTSSSGSYGMTASINVLRVRFVFLDTSVSTGFTSTVLPQMNTVLHATAINPYYMDARGTTTQARKYEVIGAPSGNAFTIRVPQMDPSTLGQVGWSILFNF